MPLTLTLNKSTRGVSLLYYLLGVVGGGLIPLQSNANRGFGEYVSSYFHAVFNSLALSGLFFILIALVAKYLLRKKVRFWRIFRREVWHWRFLVAGTPGALYMIVSAWAMNEIGPASVSVATIVGMTFYALWSDWSELADKKNAVYSGACAIVATLCSALSVGFQDPQSTIVMLGLMLFVSVLSAGIVWQFGVLANIARESSVLSASIVSSATGALTTSILLVGAVLFAGAPLTIPFSVWPSQPNEWWMYGAPVAAIGIIALSTLVTGKIGQRQNAIVGAAGNAMVGFLLGIMSMGTGSFLWWALRIISCVAAIASVVFSRREQRPTGIGGYK